METNPIIELESLKKEIINLEKTLSQKRSQFFRLRLFKLVNFVGISSIIGDIEFDIDENWSITYTHYTDKYDENNYIYDSDSELETDPRPKTTKITFGNNEGYFIQGNHGDRFIIYRNSKNILRIVNADYTAEIGIADQTELVKNYSNNINIPEWLAIKLFLYMSENDWDDNNIKSYLSIV